jgi:hypothetical protein
MLTIVSEQIVAALAQPRASAPHDVLCAETVGGAARVHAAISNKVLQGNFLDATLVTADAATVMNDTAVA